MISLLSDIQQFFQNPPPNVWSQGLLHNKVYMETKKVREMIV